jgi:hypothetical protein
MSASPLDAVKALWGGELPEFDSLDAINELLRILIMGLWNRLSRHQERSAPFRLVRIEIPETREGLAHIALIRREELDGFVEGLFGKEQSLELSERTHRSLDALSELRAIFDGLYELAGNPTKPVMADDIAQTRRNVRELTKVGEREIHEAVLSCTRASPILGLPTYYETELALTVVAGGGRSLPGGIPTTSGSSGCSGCVSDQCVGTARELIIVTLSKERPG